MSTYGQIHSAPTFGDLPITFADPALAASKLIATAVITVLAGSGLDGEV